ncbi:unnamed protein product [Caenorhabditis sp. 36 PRJEB53466]|nr:unnamed protein product [Caenorhabditis sp. 36 PRJEB53466]
MIVSEDEIHVNREATCTDGNCEPLVKEFLGKFAFYWEWRAHSILQNNPNRHSDECQEIEQITAQKLEITRSGQQFVLRTEKDVVKDRKLTIEFKLTPIFSNLYFSMDDNFAHTDLTDAVLLVEGRRMHVTEKYGLKSLLAYTVNGLRKVEDIETAMKCVCKMANIENIIELDRHMTPCSTSLPRITDHIHKYGLKVGQLPSPTRGSLSNPGGAENRRIASDSRRIGRKNGENVGGGAVRTERTDGQRRMADSEEGIEIVDTQFFAYEWLDRNGTDLADKSVESHKLQWRWEVKIGTEALPTANSVWSSVKLAWKDASVEGFVGEMTIGEEGTVGITEKFEVTENGQKIARLLDFVTKKKGYNVNIKIKMTPVFAKIYYSFLDNFTQSEWTDAVLQVGGKQLHVNKTLLSIHSDFFRALFSSNFKEKSMVEIPIEDVKYEEFARMLSLIHPHSVILNDKNYIPILELADRFGIRAVINIIESHLQIDPKVDRLTKFTLADKYGMQRLMSTCLESFKYGEEVRAIMKDAKFKKLSIVTRDAVLTRFLEF